MQLVMQKGWRVLVLVVCLCSSLGLLYLVLGLMLAVFSWTVDTLHDWVARFPAGSGSAAVAELLARLAIGVPVLVMLLLLLHPLRWPWMLARLLLRLLSRRGRPAPPSQPAVPAAPPVLPWFVVRPVSRRRFLAESAVAGALAADALLLEPGWPEVLHVDLPVRNLPERFRGFCMAQISDLHIGTYTSTYDLARIIPRVNELGADIIVVTGDIVDYRADYAAPTCEVLRELRAPEGIYSVLGNHDYYAGDSRVAAALRRADLGLLRNSHTLLRRGADRLYLIGVDDGTPGVEAADFPRALTGVAGDAPRVLLLHNPLLTPAAEAAEIDVLLSGHTHGGQIYVPYLTNAVLRKVDGFAWGHYNLGHTQLYVNRGIGTAQIAPLRFRNRPEITLLRLVPA